MRARVCTHAHTHIHERDGEIQAERQRNIDMCPQQTYMTYYMLGMKGSSRVPTKGDPKGSKLFLKPIPKPEFNGTGAGASVP